MYIGHLKFIGLMIKIKHFGHTYTKTYIKHTIYSFLNLVIMF